MTKCTTSKELAEAIKNKEDSIEIEGNLKDKVLRIKATGKVAWGACVCFLGAAILFYLATPAATAATTPAGGVGGAASLVSGVTATTAATVALGSAAPTAIAIGVAAGGVGALNTLRDRYKVVEKNDKHIVLRRK